MEPAKYPPIEDYAVIGDCKSAALIDRYGGIDWLCFPHFSGPALFSALLDRRKGGTFSLRPEGAIKRIKRRYIDNTAVLETTFHTDSGSLRLTDAMIVRDESAPHEHPEPQSEVLRVVECLSGRVTLRVDYRPRPDYARRTLKLRKYGALGWSCACNDHWYHLQSSCDLGSNEQTGALQGRIVMRAGEKHYLSLGYVQNDIGVIPPLGGQAEYRLRCTQDWWRRWSDACRYEGRYRKEVIRSAITLKLLHYSLSGAVVAAPTTSLPEAVGGDRNWDYRFCWLRDASITVRAFNELGYYYEGEAFLDWLLHATRLTLPKLQVVYDIFGETELSETTLPHLEGYRGSKPVRIGNQAHAQLQLDIYGSVIMAAREHAKAGGGLDRADKKLLLQLGDTICKEWRLRDQSIWELRGEPRHYTYSKLMCWLGLRCLLGLHADGFLKADAPRLQQEQAAIRREIESRAYWPDVNAYSGLFDDQMIDASLLMMGLEAYLPPADPRMRGLLAYLKRNLERGIHVYRYSLPGDDMRRKEGSFALCSFWTAEFEALCGETAAARERFEGLLACANDLGLYAEEIDPANGRHLGNFPQAFTHVGLINAANTLFKAERDRRSTA